MTLKAEITSQLIQQRRVYDFGVTDRHGRRVGAQITLGVRHYSPAKEDARGWFNLPEDIGFGSCLMLEVQAARNDARYGAYQHARLFKTEEAREAAIQKYLRDAMKRAKGTQCELKTVSHYDSTGALIHN